MMYRCGRLFLLWLVILVPQQATAESPVSVTHGAVIRSSGSHDLNTLSASGELSRFKQKAPFGGYYSGHQWIQLTTDNVPELPGRVLVVAPWWIDDATVYWVDETADELVSEALSPLAWYGLYTPHAYQMPADFEGSVYVRLHSQTALPSSFKLWHASDYRRFLVERQWQVLLTLGAAIACIMGVLLYAFVARVEGPFWLAVLAAGLSCFLAVDAAVLPLQWLHMLKGHIAAVNPMYILPAVFGGLGLLRWVLPSPTRPAGLQRFMRLLHWGVIGLWLLSPLLAGTYLLQITNTLVIVLALLILVVSAVMIRASHRNGLYLLAMGITSLTISIAAMPLAQPWLPPALVGASRWLLPFCLLMLAIVMLAGRLKLDRDERDRLRLEAKQSAENRRRELEQEVAKQTQALERARQTAEELGRVKDRFMSAMAHDLRSPLTTIVGIAELSEDDTTSISWTRQRAMLKRAGRYIMDLLEDLTLFERLRSSAPPEQGHDTVLADLAEELRVLLADRAADKAVQFRVSVPHSAPVVITDRRYVLRILVNLASNAITATPSGGDVVVDLSVNTQSNEPRLELTVTDTGKGLSDDEIQALQSGVSAGYGFTVVTDLVSALTGDLAIESTLGVGTRVQVTIPITLPTKQAVPSMGATALTSQRILLVEDLPENRLIISTLLNAMGHTVTECANLAEAEARLAQRSFEVVLLDRHLPDGDGLLDINRLRNATNTMPQPRFVLLTADAAQSTWHSAFSVGFDRLLVKPVTERELASVLQPAESNGRVTPVSDSDVLGLLTDTDRQRVLAGFEQTANAVLKELAEALSCSDHKALHRASHRLAGSAACVGLQDLAAQARALTEQSGSRGYTSENGMVLGNNGDEVSHNSMSDSAGSLLATSLSTGSLSPDPLSLDPLEAAVMRLVDALKTELQGISAR